jgi:hypothetical protein
LIEVGELKAHSNVYIDEVASTEKDDLMFVIAGMAYHHYYFRILAIF